MADLRDVLDSLEKTRQVTRVVLMGLCSGANFSIGYAHRDSRVVGVALMDPQIPRTRGYYMRHSLKRAAELRGWTNLLTGRSGVWSSLRNRGGTKPSAPDELESEEPLRMTADHPEARTWLEAAYGNAVSSGVEILAVFTGGLPHRLNYREQLIEAFPAIPFGAQLRLEYREDSDHEFTLEFDRNWLFDVVLEWTANTSFTREALTA
jgi:hypothetical protein